MPFKGYGDTESLRYEALRPLVPYSSFLLACFQEDCLENHHDGLFLPFMLDGEFDQSKTYSGSHNE